MIRTLPKEMASLFLAFREDVRDLLSSVERSRPFSRRHLVERVKALAETVDSVEFGILHALNHDPNYNPDPWDDDDLVVLAQPCSEENHS